MPIYDYQCQECTQTFSHLWRTFAAAEAEGAPACPHCGSDSTRRVVSQVAVLGEVGGLTPGEQTAENAQHERMSQITPKEQIDKLRAAKT